MLDTLAGPIPLTRLDDHDPALMQELLDAVARVASTAGFTGGPEVDRFETEFATYCGTRDAVGVGSGTEALHLGLRALGIGPGDEVVVPANSFVATAEAVTLCGATPRFADVEERTQLVTAATVERALTTRVRCVIAVHLYGRALDMEPLLTLAQKRGLWLVEDACQAHGAWVSNRRVGSFGAFAAFSFYPAKNLGAWGDAGALTTDDAQLADRVRLTRSHGERPRYHHLLPGTTARLDAIQAAVLRVKLRRLDAWNDERRRIASALTRALEGTAVVPPAPPEDTGDHVFHQFVVRADDRDSLREHLRARGVATAIHYPVPIHRTTAYARAVNGTDPAPICTRLANEVLSLPMHPSLRPAELERIAAAITEHGGR